MSYRNYAPANSHIVDASGNGDFTTVQAAITAATSGSVIYIAPGTYTENLALKDGVDLFGFDNNRVIVKGKMTASTAMTVNFWNVGFQSNSDNILAVTGSASIGFTFNLCNFAITGATGMTTSNTSSNLSFYECYISISDNNKAFDFGGNVLNMVRCSGAGVAGVTSVSSTITAGTILITHCGLQFPFTTSSGAGIEAQNSIFGSSGAFSLTWITANGTGALNRSDLCVFMSGTASCISIGTGVTHKVANCVLDSGNTNVLTGAGTVNTGGNACTNTSSGNNVNTINHLTII